MSHLEKIHNFDIEKQKKLNQAIQDAENSNTAISASTESTRAVMRDIQSREKGKKTELEAYRTYIQKLE
jgi:hypothetical protein